MKVTYNDVMLLEDVIKGLMRENKNMPVGMLLSLTRNEEAIEPHVKTVRKIGTQLTEKHGKDGKTIEKEWQELMEKEVDVSFHKIDYEQLEKDMPTIPTSFVGRDGKVKYTNIIFKYIVNIKNKK